MPDKQQSESSSNQSHQPAAENTRSGKIQGEGDYESAKRFNESEREFVKQHGTPRQPDVDADEERKLQDAEERGKARSHGREHDAVDEQILRRGIEAHGADRKKH